MKTKYRLVRLKANFLCKKEYYIQFFHGIKSSWFGLVKKEDWRFIPKDAIAAKGEYETPDTCPDGKELIDPVFGEWNGLENMYSHPEEEYLKIYFIDKYPNIQQYFDYLKIDIDAMKERNRKEKEKEGKKKKVIYYG